MADGQPEDVEAAGDVVEAPPSRRRWVPWWVVAAVAAVAAIAVALVVTVGGGDGLADDEAGKERAVSACISGLVDQSGGADAETVAFFRRSCECLLDRILETYSDDEIRADPFLVASDPRLTTACAAEAAANG